MIQPHEILYLKLIAVFCTIIALIAIRAWAESETVITWCHKEFHKDARLPGRWPKPSRIRRFFFFIFNLKHKSI